MLGVNTVFWCYEHCRLYIDLFICNFVKYSELCCPFTQAAATSFMCKVPTAVSGRKAEGDSSGCVCSVDKEKQKLSPTIILDLTFSLSSVVI